MKLLFGLIKTNIITFVYLETYFKNTPTLDIQGESKVWINLISCFRIIYLLIQ